MHPLCFILCKSVAYIQLLAVKLLLVVNPFESGINVYVTVLNILIQYMKLNQISCAIVTFKH